jgi:hypothetical protein
MRSSPTVMLFFGVLAAASLTDAFQDLRSDSASDGRIESIYIARSMRESRIAPTAFCAQTRIGFDRATFEDQYTFRSTATRSADGLMVDTNVNTIGRLHACFGSTSDATLNFYAEGVLGDVPFTGTGDCRAFKPDFPETGITVYRCFLELRDLPNGYVGGQLTTNSVVSRNAIGEQSDPPGYTQPSIATVRLWRRRPARSAAYRPPITSQGF